MSLSTGTVVFEDATLKAVELVAETMTLNNFSVSSTTSLQQATNVSNVTTNTVEFTNPTTAFVTTGNVEVGTANLFVDTSTGRVGVGTTSPITPLHIMSNQEYTLEINASSIADTSYSEMRMTGPGQTLAGLSMFCNGANRTADGGASTTTIRNNNGPIVLGNASYVNRLRNPKDEDFVYGRWTTTLDASASTDIEKNLGSGVSTPAATGTGMSGNIGRFTAPVAGYYYTICQVKNVTKGSSNLLIVYNTSGTNFATNNPYVGTYNEIIDLRGADNVEQAYNFAFVMHMEVGDYIQYRVHSTGYTDGTKKMDCSVHLINRI